MKNSNIVKFVAFTWVSFMILAVCSCGDDNVGEFRLTGNISHLIPDGSYDLNKTVTGDGQYIVFTPELSSNFEYWGLTLKQVEYYIDDILYKTETTRLCELIINIDDMEMGNHKLKARMTVIGETCDDVILEKESSFNVSSDGTVSEQHGDFYINYNYVTTGDDFIIVPELLVNRSSDGCAIDEVKYYWDGTLVSATKSSPFSLRYKVNAAEGSSHDIKVMISYHDRSSKSLTYSWGYMNYKIRTPDDGSVTWDIKSRRNDYTNGEMVSLIARAFKGTNVTKNYEIEFYFDDKLIGRSSSFPYTLDYKLENFARGSHSIKGNIITKAGDSTSAYSYEKTIIITK